MIKIAIVGEFDAGFRPHAATNEAIRYSRALLPEDVKHEWVSTEVFAQNPSIREEYQGFWIAPGSPYKNMQGALELIRFTRTNQIPTFGTCGGFQHLMIEFARNVLNIQDAQHAEYDPYASRLVVNPLACDLKGEPLEVNITDETSKVYAIYGQATVTEKYYCNFGLNPAYQDTFQKHGLRIVGSDKHKEARIMELAGHPFFVATLFVPQDNASAEQPHKLVTAFLQSVILYAKNIQV